MQETKVPRKGEGEAAITSPDGDENLNQSNIQAPMTMEFDTYDEGKDSYEKFIKKIRDKLKVDDYHRIPYLAVQQVPETPKNTEWLDIKLVAMEDEITVKVQQTNLYVCGYKRTGTTDDFFWELIKKGKHLIAANSRDIKFSGSYTGGLDGKSRLDLELGMWPFRTAIHRFAKFESPLGKNSKEARKYLLVLIQMISEAARFKTISEHINDNYESGTTLDGRMVRMENGWKRLSAAVFRTTNPSNITLLPRIEKDNPTEVVTFGDALRELGIMIDARRKRVMTVAGDYGRSLMNLEYVLVNNIDGGNLFGTVTLDDGWYTYTFYDRSSGGCENVSRGGFATLTDSSHSFSVSGADAFVVRVDLFDHTSARGVAHGEIAWDSLVESVTLENYDKHLQQGVKGAHGDVTVGYSVITNALDVTIQVFLENADGESTAAEVYGTLGASQLLGGSAGSAPITLLHKSSEEHVEVGKGLPVPLTRNIIAASMSTVLTITADLWANTVRVQGSVDFTVKQGTYRKEINGQDGSFMNVIITCE